MIKDDFSPRFPNSLIEEFGTVEYLLNSPFPTGRTDAFVVAWVKSERQVRRIFSYLIYQFPIFSRKDVQLITQSISSSKKNLYFDNFINGFNLVYPKTYEDIIGETYKGLKGDLVKIIRFRNKIFHGQPTGESLSANQLRIEITKIKNWCFELAEKMQLEIGYDGFARNSFRKSRDQDIVSTYKIKIKTIEELDRFIQKM